VVIYSEMEVAVAYTQHLYGRAEEYHKKLKFSMI